MKAHQTLRFCYKKLSKTGKKSFRLRLLKFFAAALFCAALAPRRLSKVRRSLRNECLNSFPTLGGVATCGDRPAFLFKLVGKSSQRLIEQALRRGKRLFGAGRKLRSIHVDGFGQACILDDLVDQAPA